jgi:hypothetical protein
MKICDSIHKLVEVVNSFIPSQSSLTRSLCKSWIAAKSVPHPLTDVQQENHINVQKDLEKKLQRSTVTFEGHHVSKLKLAQKRVRTDDIEIKEYTKCTYNATVRCVQTLASWNLLR